MFINERKCSKYSFHTVLEDWCKDVGTFNMYNKCLPYFDSEVTKKCGFYLINTNNYGNDFSERDS